ncbi:MAG TPA: glutathione S-transferase family protein [Burkholderiaceae bacterium]
MTHFHLYGNRESGHSYKVKLLLSVASVPHEYTEIDLLLPREERPESFRSRSKFGEVPLLVHGEKTLVQSCAILHYLADHLKGFGGESAERLDRCREWLFWEANRIAMSLPHLRFARKFAPEQYPEGALQWLGQRYESDIARLEHEFSDGRRFILGDDASIADFALCGYMFWPEQAGVEFPAHVNRWLDNIRALPGWKHPYELMRP